MSAEPAIHPNISLSVEVTHAAADTPKSRIRITSRVKLINLVPYLLGFHPEKSVVVIGMRGERSTVGVTQRYPLSQPGIEHPAKFQAEHAMGVLTAAACMQALVVAYGPEPQVASLVDQLRQQAGLHNVTVAEMLRVEDGRYWSYVCTNPACCPPEGEPYELAADSALAVLLPGGVSDVFASRDGMAASIASVTGTEAQAMRRATRRAEAHMAQLLKRTAASEDELSGRALAVAEGCVAVQVAFERARHGGDLTYAEAAWLTVVLRDIQVRDDAWSRLDARDRRANQRLLRELTRLARRGYIAAPATLLAFVAWQSGNGALANVALDRALADNPRYSMAELIREAVNLGLPPALARAPMTPEEVAEAYRQRAAATAASDEHTGETAVSQ